MLERKIKINLHSYSIITYLGTMFAQQTACTVLLHLHLLKTLLRNCFKANFCPVCQSWSFYFLVRDVPVAEFFYPAVELFTFWSILYDVVQVPDNGDWYPLDALPLLLPPVQLEGCRPQERPASRGAQAQRSRR